MSSDHDEIMDEGREKSDAEKSDSPSPKKSGGGAAKPKRRGRRGKKRKQRKESGDSEEQEGSRAPDSNEESEPSNFSGQMLRPNAPHAPKNSTQFIIDDHNECRLYMSFETPNPGLSRNPANPYDANVEPGVMEPIGEDAAYVDVDYQYESPQDFDNTAYYDREFELSYKSNRFEELLRLPRERLVAGLRQLEQRLKELSDDLVKENPSPILEKLQHELLELQEKHCELQEANTRLTALVAQKEDECQQKRAKSDASADMGEEFSDRLLNDDDSSVEIDVPQARRPSEPSVETEFRDEGLSRDDSSIGIDFLQRRPCNKDASIAEFREKKSSRDLKSELSTCSMDPICDELSMADVRMKRSIDDSVTENQGLLSRWCDRTDEQSSPKMEVGPTSKDCLKMSEVGISEKSDASKRNSLEPEE